MDNSLRNNLLLSTTVLTTLLSAPSFMSQLIPDDSDVYCSSAPTNGRIKHGFLPAFLLAAPCGFGFGERLGLTGRK